MVTKVKEQIHMEETIIEDEELECILDERQELKLSVSEFRKKDKEAKAKILQIDKPMPIRIGRYIINRQSTPPRSVAFDTNGSIRVTIKHIGEE